MDPGFKSRSIWSTAAFPHWHLAHPPHRIRDAAQLATKTRSPGEPAGPVLSFLIFESGLQSVSRYTVLARPALPVPPPRVALEPEGSQHLHPGVLQLWRCDVVVQRPSSTKPSPETVLGQRATLHPPIGRSHIPGGPAPSAVRSPLTYSRYVSPSHLTQAPCYLRIPAG